MVAFGWSVAAVAAAALTTVHAVTTVDPIVIKGSKFFYKTNGTQFFIRGVAYQQDAGANGSVTGANSPDPLADSASCQRDIPYLLKLRTNAIRVYSIDPTADHDDCMSALAEAGIYVVADLSTSNESIVSTEPSWNDALYQHYSSVIDSMAKYTNTLGFFAGNEVINNATVSDTAAYVKAAVRDMKAYIKEQNYRTIGVGYATDDNPSIRGQTEDYLNCGNTDEDIDFFGYNVYSWCGNSNLQTSNYAARTQEFANYTVPAFFAEYGCIQPLPRLFTDTLALFGDVMSPVWSGGFVYEYFQAANDYGLVSVDGNSVQTLDGFSRYSTQIAKVTPSSVNAADYSATNTVQRACPAMTSGWEAATSLPPSPNEQLCSCMVKNLTCNARSSIEPTAYADLFSAACTEAGSCAGIESNSTTGKYGAYSMCSPIEQLAWAFNNYYFSNGANSQSCDFAGNATKQSPTVENGCSDLLSQAGGAEGTGMVTSAPSGTGGAGSSGSTSAAAAIVPQFDFRLLGVSLYVTLAAVAGAGIILL